MKLRETDRLFRQYVLKIFDYTCARCGRKYSPDNCGGLHVSHYFSRSHENTRFSIDNVCLLCYGCHMLWGHGEEREQYKQFMINRLGQDGYDILELRAHISKRRDDKADKIIIQDMLKEIK